MALLAPPHQRSKARDMHVEVLVGWGNHLLLVVDQQERLREQEVDRNLLEEQLGWIRNCRWQLQEWGDLLQGIAVTEHVVRSQGLYRGGHREIKALLAPVARLPRAQRVSTQLVAFVAEQSCKARPHERLVGSREVIESVFGT